ncbi:AMP-binding enzyme [Penicillium atrosanguineum]|uniref:AMP-binding enzyme n=1 Tax=Penicillium atrosanguineum TaxID=1132637 RepID=A0A9W9Q4U0_9EURO|nr:AMP-binding enzyme [Penicillium atrosanguineum]
MLRDASYVQVITVPGIEVLLQEAEAEPFTYHKSWEDGQRDPWLPMETALTFAMTSFLHSTMD